MFEGRFWERSEEVNNFGKAKILMTVIFPNESIMFFFIVEELPY